MQDTERGKRLIMGAITTIVGLVIALIGSATIVREVTRMCN